MCDQSVAVIDPRREYYRNYTDSHALCFEDLKQKVGGGDHHIDSIFGIRNFFSLLTQWNYNLFFF